MCSVVVAQRLFVRQDGFVTRCHAVTLSPWNTALFAHNGREAIDLFERERFDVILMDVQMPILNGIQATKAIRDLEKVSGKRIPVVAMTAHSMPEDRDACLAAGIDAYL